MPLNGSLEDYSPAGALRVLSSTGKTGAVRFSGEAGCTVYLHQGQLYFARDEETDQALATALVRPDRLTAEAWSSAIDAAGDEPRVGELLANNGAIDPDLLASVTLSVVYDPLIRLFREGDGAFDFEPDTVHWIGPFRTFNVDAIVNEVRRRVREVDEMSPLVPSIDSWVTVRPTLPSDAVQVTLLREDWELVTLLTAPSRIADLAGAMGRGRYSTARVVHRLAQAGLVEVVPEFESHLGADDASTMTVPDLVPDMLVPPITPVAEQAADFGSFEDLHDLEGMFDGETWNTEELTSPHRDQDNSSWDAEPAPTTLGNGFDPHPALVDPPDSDGGWSLPQRQPVALQEDLDGQVALRHRAETGVDDVPSHIPGLEGINGFRSAVGEESIAEARTSEPREDMHPNAVWLENLYAEYMDEPEVQTKKRKKETLDIAFGTTAQDDGAKVGTLRRLMDALKKL